MHFSNPDTNTMAIMFGNTLTYPSLTALGIPSYTIENIITAHITILPDASNPANTMGSVNSSGIRKDKNKPILTTTTTQDFLNWYTQLNTFCARYGIGLTPFQAIVKEMKELGLCLPGLGLKRYHEAAIHLWYIITDCECTNSIIKNIIDQSTTEERNGFKLIWKIAVQGADILGTNAILTTQLTYDPYTETIFDLVVNLKNRRDIIRLQSHEQSPLQITKQFINHVIQDPKYNAIAMNTHIHLQRADLRDTDPLPTEFHIDNLATEYFHAAGRLIPINPYGIPHGATRGASIPSNIPRIQQVTNTNNNINTRRSPRFNPMVTQIPQTPPTPLVPVNTTIQTNPQLLTNPTPEPPDFNTPPCQVCNNAHPTSQCYQLAKALLVHQFILQHSATADVCQQALTHWQARKRYTRRNGRRTGISNGEFQAHQATLTYICDKTPSDLQLITNAMDWDYIHENNQSDEDSESDSDSENM
jgi:hypothetical protein